MTHCKACRAEIAETSPLFTLESHTNFEIVDGWRLPFHLPLCSELCLESMKLRENDAISFSQPIAKAPART
jgi:hypothetical protein